MSGDKGKQDTGSDAGWSNVQSNKSFNEDKRWTGKSDDQVKKDIEDRKNRRKNEETFKNYEKPPAKKSAFMLFNALNWVSQSEFAKKQNKGMRTYFSDNVLNSKNAKKNIGYTQSEFMSLSLSEQNEVYGSYIDDRMSGRTDAYGNPIGGNRKETIKHKNKDGTYTTKSVWMGGNDNNERFTEAQIIQQNVEAEKQETETEVKITEEEYKKRRGLKGSRSMFGNAGGRGYFDPV